MICDDCKEDKKDTKETTCPYMEDIHGESVDCKLCDSCEHERCMDI